MTSSSRNLKPVSNMMKCDLQWFQLFSFKRGVFAIPESVIGQKSLSYFNSLHPGCYLDGWDPELYCQQTGTFCSRFYWVLWGQGCCCSYMFTLHMHSNVLRSTLLVVRIFLCILIQSWNKICQETLQFLKVTSLIYLHNND